MEDKFNNAVNEWLGDILDHITEFYPLNYKMGTVENGELKLNNSDKIIINHVSKLMIVKAAINNMEHKLKKDLFKTMNNEVREYTDEEISIKCVWDKEGKKRFNLKQFKEDNPELYEKYLIEETAAGYVNIY